MQGSGNYLSQIKKRIRACDYLTVAQLFLRDNFLLDRPLRSDDIKPRLLGHWGTCHGINAVYANLRAFFDANHVDFSFILGSGHGFPALQANLFLDAKLLKVDPKATLNLDGISYLCKNFSWPNGFPSHSSPLTPEVICEGGELGYALANAYGSVLGHPDKLVVVLIGDGEFETATTLASLNLNRLLGGASLQSFFHSSGSTRSNSTKSNSARPDLTRLSPTKSTPPLGDTAPAPQNGLVLPILHLNGYKISAPSISARKSTRELHQLIRGFGFYPIDIVNDSPETFQSALAQLLPDPNPAPPFLIFHSQKGATGPVQLDSRKIAGNYLSHQIPLPLAKTNLHQLYLLEDWLRSYRFYELFNRSKGFMI